MTSLTLDHPPGAPPLPRLTHPGSVDAALDALDTALTGLLELDPAQLTGEEAGAAVLRLARARNRLDAADAMLMARFDGSGLWEVAGYRSPAAWLAACGNDALSTSRGRLHHADRAARHPHLAAALARGDIGRGHLAVVDEVHRAHPRLSSRLHDLAPDLVEAATTSAPDVLRRRLLEMLHRIDPDAVDDAEARRRDRDAGLRVSALADGWGRIDGTLPPDVHARLLVLLDAARVALRRERDGSGTDGPADPDRAPAGPDAPAGPAGPAATVPARQRRLAEFDRILAAATAATAATAGTAGTDGWRLPDLGGTRPVVTVTIPVTTLTRRPGPPTHATDAAGTDAAGTDAAGTACGAPAWLHRTRALLPPGTWRMLTCDATVRRLLVDPAGIPLAAGRSTRVVTAPLRAAIEARDRWTCRFPGCTQPVDHVHHVTHWAWGGTTDPPNLASLCWFHHARVHQPGWAVTGNADRILMFGQVGAPPRPSPAPGAPR